MMKNIIGYKISVLKEENKLDAVFVLVATPIGIAEIPVEEYILLFCDSPSEAVEVLFDSAEAVKKAHDKHPFEIDIENFEKEKSETAV